MNVVFAALGGLHWLGAAALVVGYLLSVQRGATHTLLLYGARLQLVLGIALVAVAWTFNVEKLSVSWLVVKLLVALGVAGCAEAARARDTGGGSAAPLTHATGALTAVNIAVALLWKP